MPSKHNPPSDSSSSSEEEEEEEPQPTPKRTSNSTPHKPIPPSNDNDESGDDESDSEEEEDEQTPPPFKHSSKPNSTPNNESDSESDSDSDNDDTDSPTPTKILAPLDIKPISSKPMLSSSSTKPSTKKRQAETEAKDSSRKDNKKKKKVSDLVVEVDNKVPGDEQNDQKKTTFQRIWTEEDEIVILKGMISFKKKSMDINSHLSDFVDSIKDSLHTKNVSKTQVQSKMRSLKKKFNNVVKKAKPGEEDPKNLKLHDAKLYQLSKKIWNEEAGKDEEEDGKDDVKSKSKKVTTLPSNTTKQGVKDEDKKSGLEYLYLTESSVAPKFPLIPVPPLGLGNIVSKQGWDVIGSSKAQNFDQKWKNVIIAETKAYLQRLELVKEQTQTMLDALVFGCLDD